MVLRPLTGSMRNGSHMPQVKQIHRKGSQYSLELIVAAVREIESGKVSPQPEEATMDLRWRTRQGWERHLLWSLPALIGFDRFSSRLFLGKLLSGRACLRFTDWKRLSIPELCADDLRVVSLLDEQ